MIILGRGVRMETRIQSIKKALQDAKYKLTPQREVTVRVLLENEEEHLTAENIFMMVKDKYPDIGLATVYRTLELLSELRIVEKIHFGDNVSRYDLYKEGSAHFHHHLVCTNCGFVEEIEEYLLREVEEKIRKEYQFEITDNKLIFNGICRRCRTDIEEKDD